MQNHSTMGNPFKMFLCFLNVVWVHIFYHIHTFFIFVHLRSTKFNLPKYLCKAKQTELRQSNVCAIWAMSLWQVKVYGSGQLSSNIFQFVWCGMYSILWFCCLYKVWQRTNSTPSFTYHGLYKSCQAKCKVKGRCDWVQMFTFNCS